MDMSGRRGAVSSGAAAVAVVLVTVLVWWLLSGNGPEGPPGNADRLGVADEATGPPEPTGAGSAPSRGAAEPTPGDEDTSEPDSRATDDRSVRIDSYVLEAPDRLALNYTTGVPACSGRLDTPTVVEDPGGVTITLSTVPPARPADVCIELAVLKTVRVTLESPLAGRGVLDGSRSPRVGVERVATPYE
jgi:hypothetical protein